MSVQQKKNLTQQTPYSKIEGIHLDRLAVVYIRQSTMQQVERHQESTRLQYNLVDRATFLGWAAQRIIVIDDDLGKSGTTISGRPGFQRLVAEVSLDHIGIVIGLEMSRLARSCRDWYQLLDVCSVFNTLIADVDGVYDPTDYNDRLLLGLKGSMSEAELHILKRRMLEGKRAKARRGELGMQVAVGYYRRPSGDVIKDPDEQARSTIELVFEQFERYGTLYGVLKYLVKHDIKMPQRIRSGVNKGELKWSRPNRPSLSNMMRNPIYAGAYVYGRRPTDPKKKKPGKPSTGRTVAKSGEWEVLLKDHLPAYISWEQFEKNVRQLESNTAQGTGTVKNGPSFLSGILVCGRCGLKMSTQYNNNGNKLRYVCNRMMVDYAQNPCQSLAGQCLDELITQLILTALEPSALEISLKVSKDLESQRKKLKEHWEQRLERAQYDSERAFRQYNAVEPENRLVARTLERQWEESLVEHEKLKLEHARFLSVQPIPLSEEDRQKIMELAVDIPALWAAGSTNNSDRQAIIRHLIECVVVTVQGDSEKVTVDINWMGGHTTTTKIIRPVARFEQLSYYSELLDRIVGLHKKDHSALIITETLNLEGWCPPKRRDTFNVQMVRNLLSRQGIRDSSKKRPSDNVTKKINEWTIEELAQELEMPKITLYKWMRQKKITGRKIYNGKRAIYLIHADKKEIKNLQKLRIQPKTWSKHVFVD
ncbi:MAG: recombinase family protein [Deltaproteobacteria bacterium]|nr:recombinase family protein [Deltaproteobacteria bacterium]